MNKKFYELKKKGDALTELFIYGEITSLKWFENDVCSFDFAKELSEVDTPIIVHINSYGGEVSEGLAIYNLLKNFKNDVTTICDGFACSAASVIFMAGDKRIVNLGSLIMIHNAWSSVTGDSNTFKKKAEELEIVTKPSLDIYESVSNLSRETIKSMMDEEKWITPDEALEWGFATEIIKDESKQSINEMYLNHQVILNKQLEKKYNNLNKAYRELETELKKQELSGWDAFFSSNK